MTKNEQNLGEQEFDSRGFTIPPNNPPQGSQTSQDTRVHLEYVTKNPFELFVDEILKIQ